MVDRTLAVAAALMWVLVAAKARGTARSGSPSARWLLATLALLALGITVLVPVVQSWLTRAIPVTEIQEPLARTAIVAAAFCAQSLFTLVRGPVERRRAGGRVAAAAVTVAVMWVTFASAPSPLPARFGSHPVEDNGMTLYMLAFLVYIAWAIGSVMLGCWRLARSSPASLRWSLRSLAAGCACCLGYVGVKVTAILCFRVGASLPAVVESRAGQGCVAVGALLVTGGSAAVEATERTARLRAWARDWRVHRRLYPLWGDLMAAVPGVALQPSEGRWRDALQVRDMHLRLYRRVIEIRDAWLALRPFIETEVATAAQRSSLAGPAAASPDLEAALLRAAVSAQSAGRRAAQPWNADPAFTDSLDDELVWWSAVADAWRQGNGERSAPRSRASVGGS